MACAASSWMNRTKEERNIMSILWIILIVVVVLALLGFFARY